MTGMEDDGADLREDVFDLRAVDIEQVGAIRNSVLGHALRRALGERSTGDADVFARFMNDPPRDRPTARRDGVETS